MPTSLPESLDQHRIRLEQSLEQLRKSLHEWRLSCADYEAFREELELLPADVGRERMLAVGKEVAATKLSESDIQVLLNDRNRVQRSRDQVIAAIGHRIDYASKNVESLETRVAREEQKLNALLVVSEPTAETEDGLPLMDIQEVIDEEGNLISATVNGKDPEAALRAVDPDALKPFEDFIEEGEGKEDAPTPTEVEPVPAPESVSAPSSSQPAAKSAQDQSQKPQNGETTDRKQQKEIEGITQVKIEPEPKNEEWVESIAGETEEETQLRRDMLKYNLQEVGAVVAEINLEEEGDYYGYEPDDDNNDDDDDDDDEEFEDEYGRTTLPVVTDTYRREMEELQRKIKERAEEAKKLDKQEQQNAPRKKKGVRFAEELDISPAPPPLPPPEQPEQPQPQKQKQEQEQQKQPQQMKVLTPDDEDALPFLVNLLANEQMKNAGPNYVPRPPAPTDEPARKPKPAAAVKRRSVTETETAVPSSVLRPEIRERDPGDTHTPPEAPKPRKVSRFKAAQQASFTPFWTPSLCPSPAPAAALPKEPTQQSTQPSQPAQQPAPKPKSPMSNIIIEHPPEETATAEVRAPDDLDPELHRQEIAMHYHKLRTRMIQKQGGFVETDEDKAIVPLDEHGEKQKISRFMAARLKGLGPPPQQPAPASM